MKITSTLSDEAVVLEVGQRLEQARIERGLTQAELAEGAGISKRTIERIESGAVAAQLTQLVRISRALGILERWDALIPEPGISPMALLKLQKNRRQRVTKRKASDTLPQQWTWGDER
ncbi:MAG: XRE family transcriptional regulator [Ignavibacteriae bacterium]|nr:MAG: XRE family transcriptional regulator [Ignavibacteriota bacterium]